MVSIQYNGNNIPVSYAEFVTDLSDYYFYLRVCVASYIPLFTKVAVVGSSSEDYYVLESRFDEARYSCKLVSEAQFRAMAVLTSPFKGECSVRKLLNFIGAPEYVSNDSKPSWWMVPSLSLPALISTLNDFAVIDNGGAPRFYLDMSGTIRCVDLVVQMGSKAVPITGEIESDISGAEWMLSVPSAVKCITSSINGESNETVEFKKDFIKGIMWQADTTCESSESFKRVYRNEYMWKLLTSRVVQLVNVRDPEIFPGKKVSYFGSDFVVMACQTPLDEWPSTVRATLVCQG